MIDRKFLPYALKKVDEMNMAESFEKWLEKRMIPNNRLYLEQLMKASGGKQKEELFLLSYGENMTDGFWIKEEKDPIAWENIDYIKNGYSGKVGNFVLSGSGMFSEYLTPDFSTNGRLQKVWRHAKGDDYLLKRGSFPRETEPFNEAFATEVMKKILHVPFVEYSVDIVLGHPVSICKNFMKRGQELVPAGELVKWSTSKKFSEMYSMEQKIREACRALKIPGSDRFLDEMNRFDYITSNVDRHAWNYGFIFDTEKQEFTGPAPLYDNGNSMWTTGRTIRKEIENASELEAKLVFKGLSNRSTHHISKDILAELLLVFDKVYESSHLDEREKEKIKDNFTQRVRCFNQELNKERRKEERKEEREYA